MANLWFPESYLSIIETSKFFKDVLLNLTVEYTNVRLLRVNSFTLIPN